MKTKVAWHVPRTSKNHFFSPLFQGTKYISLNPLPPDRPRQARCQPNRARSMQASSKLTAMLPGQIACCKLPATLPGEVACCKLPGQVGKLQVVSSSWQGGKLQVAIGGTGDHELSS